MDKICWIGMYYSRCIYVVFIIKVTIQSKTMPWWAMWKYKVPYTASVKYSILL